MRMSEDERLRRKRIRGKAHYRKNREYYIARAKRRHVARQNDPTAAREFLDYKRRRAGLPEPTRPCPEYCEICSGPPRGKPALVLDHDHATGEFRGWLCSPCNMGLGMLGDTPVALAAALQYLRADK